MREYDLSNARWRKSSYSGGSGGESCVEVAYDFPGAAWRKSSHSDGTGGSCVEVLDGLPGVVPVRDSKNPSGPALVVTAAAWVAFISDIKG